MSTNLDVTLRTLQAFAPQAKIVVVMQPGEAAHIGKLLELFPVHAVSPRNRCGPHGKAGMSSCRAENEVSA